MKSREDLVMSDQGVDPFVAAPFKQPRKYDTPVVRWNVSCDCFCHAVTKGTLSFRFCVRKERYLYKILQNFQVNLLINIVYYVYIDSCTQRHASPMLAFLCKKLDYKPQSISCTHLYTKACNPCCLVVFLLLFFIKKH